MSTLHCITLQHLIIDQQRKIGLQFYPNPAVHIKIKQLPQVRWSKKHNMVVLPNTKKHLQAIYTNFKGIAYINGKYFFKKGTNKLENNPISLQKQRDRKTDKGYKKCPVNFLEQLEIRRYALNTAQSYITCFEAFINYFKDRALNTINEQDINQYLVYLNSKKYSSSYLNVAINSIKFYYEVVLGMPNRFYSIARPRKKEALPKVISKEEVALIVKGIKPQSKPWTQ